MLYEFKVNNCIKSNLKLLSPSPRIAATTWSAPSFNFSGHCRQVEAHLEQHVRVYVYGEEEQNFTYRHLVQRHLPAVMQAPLQLTTSCSTG